MAHSMPVPVSPMVGPGRIGGPSGRPLTPMVPPIAWAIMSKRQVVGVRALRREALDLGEDQARIDGAQPRIVEAQSREGARRHVLDEHVRLLDQPREQRLALLALEIAGDAALVEVEVDEIVGVGVGAVAEAPAARLAAVGLLHLDDVGAEPGQRLGAGGARLELGEVENLDARQRRRRAGRWCLFRLPCLASCFTPMPCLRRASQGSDPCQFLRFYRNRPAKGSDPIPSPKVHAYPATGMARWL